MSSLCWECKYEHSDCKGNHEDDCANFSKKGAVNYPQRIRELETELRLNTELCEVFRRVVKFENSKLKSENEKWRIDFEANAEAYDIQGKQLLEALDEIEKLKEENVDLGFESVRAFERGQKFPCNLNCDECTEKCRAWQNGYNATCERECDNCEVIADMQNLKNVLNKLMFDYVDVREARDD